MDDIFYFAPTSVTPFEIRNAAKACGMMDSKIVGSTLQVISANGEGLLMSWAPFDLKEAELQEQEELQSCGIESAYCITHHRKSLPLILPILELLLKRFGGWAGNDDDGFKPRFDKNSISLFCYPDG